MEELESDEPARHTGTEPLNPPVGTTPEPPLLALGDPPAGRGRGTPERTEGRFSVGRREARGVELCLPNHVGASERATLPNPGRKTTGPTTPRAPKGPRAGGSTRQESRWAPAEDAGSSILF